MPVESTDPHVLPAHRGAAMLAGAPWRRFAMLGDSIVAGVGDPTPGYRDVPWGDRVAEALRRAQPGLQYLNVGERDRTVDEVAEEQLPGVLAFGPHLAAVNGGANDMFRRHFDAAAVAHRHEGLVTALAASGATVITWTMFGLRRGVDLPEPWGSRLRGRYTLVQDLVRDVAARHDTIFVDFEAHPLSGDPSIYSADLIHLNRRGHAVVASEIVAALGRRLAAVRRSAA